MQSGVVLSMMDQLSQKQFNACTLVETYWDNLRREGALPLRSAIDPRGIEDALNYAFILESIGTGVARLRVAGMHLNELIGMEVRGMPISSFITPASREAFARVLVSALKSPAKMQLSLSAEEAPRAGGKPLCARMLLLPLADDQGAVTRILGCLETKGQFGDKPHRFELTGVKKVSLDRPRRAEAAPRFVPQHPTPQGFAEAPRPLTAQRQRVPHLTLVKSEQTPTKD